MNLYRIGDLNIGLNAERFPLKRDNFSSVFQIEPDSTAADIIFDLHTVCPEQLGKMEDVRRTPEFDLVRIEERLFLVNHWGRCRFGYGLWLDDLKKSETVPVYVNSALREELPLTSNRMLSTIGLHSKLLQREAPVLHASFIVHENSAILFTAPAGTGKSTQADLWHKHAGAEIINGDRVLLRKRNGAWHAFGYPCSGSSGICRDEAYPMKAIVVLEQGPENRVVAMRASEKIKALVSATEVYPWDMDEIDMAIHCAQKLVENVEIVRLACRPDEDAVKVLRNFLEANDDAECN